MFAIFDLKQLSGSIQLKSPPPFTTSFKVILLLTNSHMQKHRISAV